MRLATLAALISSVLARPADQDPVQFVNTLFYQQTKNPTLPPFTVCQPASKFDKGLADNFYWCELSWQRFSYTPQDMRALWQKIQAANDSTTTINSRRQDYSVEQFDGVSDNAAYYTVEHGAGCRAGKRPGETCLMVVFYRKFA